MNHVLSGRLQRCFWLGLPLTITAACLLFLLSSWARAEDRATLPADVHRVLILGDSITYAGQYVCDVETYFITRYPDRKIEFINAGLPSENVSGLSEPGHAGGKFPRPDLHERLGRALEQTKPDLVFACYGMNDGIYLPFDEDRFAKFKDGINWLHEQVAQSGAKIVLLTPPTFDELKGGHAGYRDTLDRYADWLLSQRKVGWDIVDLHGPMNRYLDEHRAKDPSFAFGGDGVHPNDQGHWVMARQVLLHLGAKDVENAEDAVAMASIISHGDEILKLVRKKQDLMKDAWLSATGHKRPGMRQGLPLDEAKAKEAELEAKIRELVKPGA